MKRVEAVVAAMQAQKAFSPQMLGQGRPHGGTREHMKNRHEVLERLRRIGPLTEQQKGQWEYFKNHWDAAQAETIGPEWGLIFAEQMNQVQLELLRGDQNAFSDFVKRETDRVLYATGVLVVPGVPASVQGEEASA